MICTVIVPVLGRPQNAAPFMASLRASSHPADGLAQIDVLAICSEDADEAAWRETGARVTRTRSVTFPQKVNTGYGETVLDNPPSRWVFITGDDVRFHFGWLRKALVVATRTNTDVIGTNDLGNARVMMGEHGIHLLIRRRYIAERGASWDRDNESGAFVCHEGYRHWFVDDEIVQVAKERGMWASAPDSIVEHLHPEWGKAPIDATYELGAQFKEQDLERFRYRALKYGAVRA